MAQKNNSNYLGIASKIIASLLITVVLFITALIALMNTSYGLPFLQKTVERIANITFQASEFTYNLRKPFTFYFKDLSIISGEKNIDTIEELNITISPLESILNKGFVFKDAWLKGGTLKRNSQISLPKSLRINELSLEEINLRSENLWIDNTDIQLANWKNDGVWGNWEGSFMLSADKANFAEENFQDILITGTKQGENWEFWSVSLSSNFGELSTSASLSPDKLYFEQFSLSDAKILPVQDIQSQKFYAKIKPWIEHYQIDFNRLDLVNISGAIKNANIESLNLTAHNIALRQGQLEWQPKAFSRFSFNAESLNYEQWAFAELLGEVSISEKEVDISTFTSKLQENGFVAVSGQLSKTAIDLSELSITGIALPINGNEFARAKKYWQSLDDITLDNISIKRTDIKIDEPDFPVYIKDLNLRGQNISGKKSDADKVWQGDITLSATSADMNEVNLINPLLSVTINENKWELDSELPFNGGQLKLSAHLNTLNSSHPWQLQGEGISVPNNIYQQWFNAKLPLAGRHDLELDLYGLSITNDALRYSLSGTVNARLYNSTLQPSNEAPLAKELAELLIKKPKNNGVGPQTENPEVIEKTTDIAFSTEENDFTSVQEELASMTTIKAGKITLVLDRGQITLNPTPISTQNNDMTLQGKWDVVTQQGGFTAK